MGGVSSRSFTVSWDSTSIPDLQSKSFTINAEPVDTTTDDDAGWRNMLDEPGVKSISLECVGIADDEALLADIMAASDLTKACVINLPSTQGSPGNLTGNFMITNFGYDGSSPADAVEFTVSFESQGAVTYTASSA